MKPTSELFELIKSLSKGEKRLFRNQVMGTKEKAYVELFDVLDKMKSYDETELKRKYENSGFVKNLPVTKRYLYDQILQSQRKNVGGGILPFNEVGMLLDIITLIEKRLFEQAHTRILRAKKRFEVKPDGLFLLILYRIENTLFHRWYNPKMNPRLLEMNQEQELVLEHVSQLLKIEATQSQLRILMSKHGVAKSDAEREQATQIMGEWLEVEPSDITDYMIVITLCRSFVEYFSFIGQPAKGVRYARYQIDAFNRMPEEVQEKFRHTLSGSYASYFIACENVSYYHDFEKYLNEIRVGPENDFRTFETWALFQFSWLNITGKFDDAVQHAAKVEAWLETDGHNVLKPYVMHFPIQLARTYIGAGEYDKALEWTLKLLDKDYYQEIVFYAAKINQLVCHIELKNIEILDSLWRSTYRAWKSTERIDELETLMFKAIRIIVGNSNESEQRKELKSILPEMSRVFNDPLGQSSALFDYETWVRSKVEKRSFAACVEEKFQDLLAQSLDL